MKIDNHTDKLEILREIDRLKHNLKLIERKERALEYGTLNNRKSPDREEYERRTALGEVLDPFVEKKNLETLVGSEIYESVLEAERTHEVHTAALRGQSLKFYTPNRRALWQSFGQEYIEPDLLDFIDSVPKGGVYFDVGASTGIFAVYAAVLGRSTYCFEPEISNFNILNTNAFLNYESVIGKMNAFNIALSDKTALDKMFIRKFEAATHEKILGHNRARDGSEKFDVEYEQSIMTMTMDEFCHLAEVQPTDIKIDVDGAELALVKGMKETLESNSLKRIFIEVSEVERDSVEALEIIRSSGFEVVSKMRVQNYFTEYNYTLIRSQE